MEYFSIFVFYLILKYAQSQPTVELSRHLHVLDDDSIRSSIADVTRDLMYLSDNSIQNSQRNNAVFKLVDIVVARISRRSQQEHSRQEVKFRRLERFVKNQAMRIFSQENQIQRMANKSSWIIELQSQTIKDIKQSLSQKDNLILQLNETIYNDHELRIQYQEENQENIKETLSNHQRDLQYCNIRNSNLTKTVASLSEFLNRSIDKVHIQSDPNLEITLNSKSDSRDINGDGLNQQSISRESKLSLLENITRLENEMKVAKESQNKTGRLLDDLISCLQKQVVFIDELELRQTTGERTVCDEILGQHWSNFSITLSDTKTKLHTLEQEMKKQAAITNGITNKVSQNTGLLNTAHRNHEYISDNLTTLKVSVYGWNITMFNILKNITIQINGTTESKLDHFYNRLQERSDTIERDFNSELDERFRHVNVLFDHFDNWTQNVAIANFHEINFRLQSLGKALSRLNDSLVSQNGTITIYTNEVAVLVKNLGLLIVGFNESIFNITSLQQNAADSTDVEPLKNKLKGLETSLSEFLPSFRLLQSQDNAILQRLDEMTNQIQQTSDRNQIVQQQVDDGNTRHQHIEARISNLSDSYNQQTDFEKVNRSYLSLRHRQINLAGRNNALETSLRNTQAIVQRLSSAHQVYDQNTRSTIQQFRALKLNLEQQLNDLKIENLNNATHLFERLSVAMSNSISTELQKYNTLFTFGNKTRQFLSDFDTCSIPLVENLPANQISASSYLPSGHPSSVQFDRPHVSWRPRGDQYGQWLSFNFRSKQKITKIIIMGHVIAFRMTYTVNGADGGWIPYSDAYSYPAQKIFRPNGYMTNLQEQSYNLLPHMLATRVRILPMTWRGWISLKVELYGCPLALKQQQENYLPFLSGTESTKNHWKQLCFSLSVLLSLIKIQ